MHVWKIRNVPNTQSQRQICFQFPHPCPRGTGEKIERHISNVVYLTLVTTSRLFSNIFDIFNHQLNEIYLGSHGHQLIPVKLN